MRHLRVYNWQGDLLADMPHVQWSTVTTPGALVVGLARVPGAEATIKAYAPGFWGEVTEIPALPIVPGPVTDDDLAPFFGLSAERPQTGDHQAVHEALKVHCLCDSMRCTSTLNPATADEKKAVQKRGWGRHTGPVEEPEPLQRCVRARGHDTVSMPCYWQPGVWTWGIHEHHAGCPRHPSRYNRSIAIMEEGQPSAAGVTSTGEQLPESATTLVRPFTASLGGELPEVRMPPLPEPWSAALRERWQCCAVTRPQGEYPFDVWCTMAIDHAGDLHEMIRSGGERITWERRGEPTR